MLKSDKERRDGMNKKPITTMVLTFTCALAAAALSAAPAAATPPASPGACNMLHTSPTGFAGMLKASDQGLNNMIALVVASEESGCVPH
jgi:hypothetical protein